jgi:hypothetical protein
VHLTWPSRLVFSVYSVHYEDMFEPHLIKIDLFEIRRMIVCLSSLPFSVPRRTSSPHMHCNLCVNGTLAEYKMRRFKDECAHFSFNKRPIYTHDGASYKFSTNSQETDYSVPIEVWRQLSNFKEILHTKLSLT